MSALRLRARLATLLNFVSQAAANAAALCFVVTLAGCGGGSEVMMGPPPPSAPPQIVTPSVAGGMATFPYSQTIEADSGTPPFTWSVSSGVLPQNLSLGPPSGRTITISGTPTSAESETFTLEVKDSANMADSRAFTINVKALTAVQLQEVAGSAPGDSIEIQGLSAGAFNPSEWLQETLNWVPDVRAPMFASQPGAWQNVYAPWALEQPNGWRLFYGGWDGTDTPNDRVYSGTTSDFLSFANRHLVIDHGIFQHVNNANVHQLPDGTLHMLYGYLAGGTNGLDKIGYVSSQDGVTWNGVPEPYTAQVSDSVTVTNDPIYPTQDYNGGNVLLRESNSWTMYYSKGAYGQGNGNVYRATSTEPPVFNAAGTALASSLYANDVKKFTVAGQDWYVMVLYYEALNVGEPPAGFSYSMSLDGIQFRLARDLFGGAGAEDKFPTTPSFVTQNGRILGVLYGGDRLDDLDGQNSIFARWLQKNVVLQDSMGAQYPASGSYGPDRQWFLVPASGTLQGTITIFAEDGVTPLGSGPVTLTAGKSYQFIAP